MAIKSLSSLQKFVVLALISGLVGIGCRRDEERVPEHGAETDVQSIASVADDLARGLAGILSRYSDEAADVVQHNADDVARIASSRRTLGIVGQFGGKVHSVYRQSVAAANTTLARLLPATGDLPFVHHWDDAVARVHHALEDVKNGTAIIDGGDAGRRLVEKAATGQGSADEVSRAMNLIKYTVPSKNIPKLFSKTAAVNSNGELFLSLDELVKNSPFSKAEVMDLISRGQFGPDGTHEVIWVAMKGEQIVAGSPGVSNMVLSVSQKARSAAAYAAETKTQHLWLIGWLRNGQVTLANARVAGAGQVKLGGIAKLNNLDVVKVNGFNMCSGHTRPPLRVVGAFVTALVSMVGANNFKVEGAGSGICY